MFPEFTKWFDTLSYLISKVVVCSTMHIEQMLCGYEYLGITVVFI